MLQVHRDDTLAPAPASRKAWTQPKLFSSDVKRTTQGGLLRSRDPAPNGVGSGNQS